jgi:PAS domain S-box-containing protein
VEPTTRDSALQDPARLSALEDTGMLDTPPEESIDRFTRLAQRLLGAPLAQLSLVDDRRQFHKSRIGPPEWDHPTEAPLAHSICQYVVARGEELVVADAREDPELRDNLSVTVDGTVAYAGVPIALRQGHVLGTFCVASDEPREWSDDDLRILRDLGAAVAAEIELRAQLNRRRRVERELARATRHLRGILDHSPALIYVKDLEGRYVLVNERFVQRLGVSNADVIGTRDADLLDAETAGHIRDEERRVIETGEPVEELRTLEGPRGVEHWRTLKFAIRDEDGEIYALCGIATEETERIAREAALHATEERLRSAFDDAPIGMALLRAGRFVRVNRALCELLGYTEEQLLERTIRDVAHPGDFARDAPEVARLLSGEIPVLQADTRLIRADGSCRDVLLNSTALGEGGEPSEVAIQVQDVTDRRRARREINLRHEASRALFDAEDIVEAAPAVLAPMASLVGAHHAALWLTDDDGILRRVSTWGAGDAEGDATLRERVLGQGAILWTGSSVCVPVQTQREAAPLGLTEFAVREGDIPRGEILDHLLTLTGGIGLFIERRRHDAELARARDEALEASRMKSSFLANMSHEIRTPMNGVIGMSDLLLASDLSEEQRRWAATLRTSGRALLTIIDDILDFSKVEAGKLELERVQFGLGDIVDATCDILAEQARKKGLQLEAFIERRVPERMWGDPGRLQQVLTNLMANAVKFTERGSVTLRASISPTSENDVRFAVTDTGIGISPEKIQELFEPFSQADSSTTRRFGGTGLGLTISRQLVELMGGEISATSTPGEGTTFEFTIPLGRAQDVPADHAGPDRRRTPAPVAVAAPAPGGRAVLVVDDNQVNQMVAAEMLRRSGYDVEIASDGREAVLATERRRFDAVLMDCQMPVMDGFEATQEIRRREADGPRVPIIALTSSSMKGDRDTAMAAGMDGFLAKPVTADALLGTVERWAGTSSRNGAPEPPDLDREVFDAAVGETGDPSLGPELAKLFESEAENALGALRAGLADGDARVVARAAHGLKGSSSTLGAARVAALAAELERAGRDGRLEATPELMDRLGPAVEAASEALHGAAGGGS